MVRYKHFSCIFLNLNAHLINYNQDYKDDSPNSSMNNIISPSSSSVKPQSTIQHLNQQQQPYNNQMQQLNFRREYMTSSMDFDDDESKRRKVSENVFLLYISFFFTFIILTRLRMLSQYRKSSKKHGSPYYH